MVLGARVSASVDSVNTDVPSAPRTPRDPPDAASDVLPAGVGTTVPAGAAAGPAGETLALAGATVSFLAPSSLDDPQPESTSDTATSTATPPTDAESRRAVAVFSTSRSERM